ncbi:MAG: hypothetical protein KKI08_04115, partial [Armatimonadetes bacterium]|nr:hypothetical protein [Armatimonadota bacterium]
ILRLMDEPQLRWCLCYRRDPLSAAGLRLSDTDLAIMSATMTGVSRSRDVGVLLRVRHGLLVLYFLGGVVLLARLVGAAHRLPPTVFFGKWLGVLIAIDVALLLLIAGVVPRNYGALVLPPTYARGVLPAPPPENPLGEWYLVTPPGSSECAVFVGFPLDGSACYTIRTADPASIQRLDVVGIRDMVAEDLPPEEDMSVREAIVMMAHSLSQEASGRGVTLPPHAAVRVLTARGIILPDEASRLMAYPDEALVTTSAFEKWLVLSAMSAGQQDSLRRSLATAKGPSRSQRISTILRRWGIAPLPSRGSGISKRRGFQLLRQLSARRREF